jgi:hypothetical protein
MPGLTRKNRKLMIRGDQKKSRLLNGERKGLERARRGERMKNLVRKGKLPYTPSIMSWLSIQLDKPSRLITQAEVDKVLMG